MTCRTRGISLPQLIEELTPYLIGWRGYFGFCQTPRVLTNLEAWIRRRLRSYLWRQWGNGHNRFNELRRRGVSKFRAAVAAGSPTGFWRMSGHPAVQPALRNHYFDSTRSPPTLCSRPSLTRSNRRGTDPYARWCGRGGAVRRPPIPINPPHPFPKGLTADDHGRALRPGVDAGGLHPGTETAPYLGRTDPGCGRLLQRRGNAPAHPRARSQDRSHLQELQGIRRADRRACARPCPR